MGVLIVPSFLLYATGGLAYGGARSDTTIVQSIDDPPLSTLMTSGSFFENRVGYAVGAGGEWMLSSNWSAKLEYLTDRQSPAVKHRCVRRATLAIQVRSESRKPPDILRLADAPARRSRACLHPDGNQLLG